MRASLLAGARARRLERPSLRALRAAALLAVAALAATGCSASDPAPAECAGSSECGEGEDCVDGACLARSDAGGGVDAGEVGCDAGQVRREGGCLDECGSPEARPCDGGEVCAVDQGVCVASGTPGLLPQTQTECGASTCGPGTECSVDQVCEPIPACARMNCTPDGAYCWGRSCEYERRAGPCEPPPLARLNADDFLLGGDGGAFDLEFDEACFAYSVTMISGTDYLRQLSPEGELTVFDGVENLNMGEVAVLRPLQGEFGDEPGEVALTYVCCATCGCRGDDPQGVARLDREGGVSLPMVVQATPTTGAGPWDAAELDTGPYGLTWGRDRTLYIGNASANGDFVRASLVDGTTTTLHRFEARVSASAVYSARSLVVALEGGALRLASTATDTSRPLTTVGGEVTSLFRDPLTGHLFVALGDGRVLELEADGAEVGVFASFEGPVRIARSPDGYLYALDPGWPRPGAITRAPLPATRD